MEWNSNTSFSAGSAVCGQSGGMMKNALIALVGAFATLASAAAADANGVAQSRPDMRDRYTADEARDAMRSGDVLPALRVIREVRQQYPGAEVLDAELEGGQPPLYIIKILTRDGRRVDVIVDARTGAVLYER